MATNNPYDNKSITLAGVVSVDAWYKKFSETCQKADFFMHVRFKDGVFGGLVEHPVSFRIRLKNANISIVPEEPIQVPRHHVRRDRIEVEVKRITEGRVAASGHIAGKAEGEMSLIGGDAKVSGESGGRMEGELSDGYSVTKVSHSGMTIEHSIDDKGFNCWSFAPVAGPHLLGQAFKKNDVLLKMTHEGDVPKIPPVVKVQVSCLREDIDVVDLEVKEERRGMLSRGMGTEQKLKLVEEMIKTALIEGGLSFEGEMDQVSKVQVADVTAVEE